MPAAAPPPETFEVDTRGNRLRGDAAASYLRMVADGLPVGGVEVFLRSLKKQKQLYERYLKGRGAVAAKPTPTAPHVRGVAMDLHTKGAGGSYDPSPAHTWLTKGGDGSRKPTPGEQLRAHDYGWFRTVKSERWHFAYDRASDTRRAADLTGRLTRLGFADVKAFQRSRGLEDDGKDGPLTWTALLNASETIPTGVRAMAASLVGSSVVVPTLARLATFNCAGFGKSSMTDREVDAIVGVLLTIDASIYTLTECPEWLRDHIRGACSCVPGAHRTVGDPEQWRVAVRGGGFSQAILFDAKKWAYLGASRGEFGPTSYHGYLIAGLEQTTTKTVLTVGCYHLPPNSVASDSFQRTALAKLLDHMPSTGPRLLGGDGADESGWVSGWDDARVIAKRSANRKAATYKNTIRDRVHSRGVQVRRYTVFPSGGASDHAGVLAQITVPALSLT